MENQLRKLFDYQTFVQNDRLSAMIAATEGRYGMGRSHLRELSIDEVDLVNAAGSAEVMHDSLKINAAFTDPTNGGKR